MSRFRAGWTALLVLGFAAACAKDSPSVGSELVAPDASIEASTSGSAGSDGDSDGARGRRFIAMLDDCDPRDPAWAPTGGCFLRRGNVTFTEFNAENYSPPLAVAVIGHQAWRNEPSYLVVQAGKDIRVKNEGGRPHTFTKVKRFGGGRVPPLTIGLVPAPECATAPNVPAGASIRVSDLAPGNNRFQCCNHPWMRAIIKVKTD